jgi:phage shock protein A
MESLQRLSKTVEKQDEEIQALRQRLDRLEAREDLYLAKIEAAAAKATADMAGRLGRIEGMVEARDRRG